MKTHKDYTFNYLNYGEITIPSGVNVTNETAMGFDYKIHFLNQLDWIDEKYPEVSGILKHDMTYYAPDIPLEYIDKYKDVPKKKNYLTLMVLPNSPTYNWYHYHIGKFFFSCEEHETTGDFIIEGRKEGEGTTIKRSHVLIVNS
jgi:hypothetical protein